MPKLFKMSLPLSSPNSRKLEVDSMRPRMNLLKLKNVSIGPRMYSRKLETGSARQMMRLFKLETSSMRPSVNATVSKASATISKASSTQHV